MDPTFQFLLSSVGSLSCSQMLDQAGKASLCQTIKLICKRSSLFGPFVGEEEKSGKTLTPGVNVINFFPLLLMMRPKKLECLYLAISFQSSLTFADSTRSLPKKEASERCSNWVGSGLALKF
jgi:hypothetical protein